MIDRNALAPGLAVPPFSRLGSFQHWNRYAGVNYEFADHHMDDAVGRHEGFDAAVGMGPLIHALMHCMLRAWIDADAGRVAALAMQLRSPFLRGRTLTAQGAVTGTRAAGDELLIDIEIWADDDAGARIVKGTATVAIPK
jgi:hypothetical protein